MGVSHFLIRSRRLSTGALRLRTGSLDAFDCRAGCCRQQTAHPRSRLSSKGVRSEALERASVGPSLQNDHTHWGSTEVADRIGLGAEVSRLRGHRIGADGQRNKLARRPRLHHNVRWSNGRRYMRWQCDSRIRVRMVAYTLSAIKPFCDCHHSNSFPTHKWRQRWRQRPPKCVQCATPFIARAAAHRARERRAPAFLRAVGALRATCARRPRTSPSLHLRAAASRAPAVRNVLLQREAVPESHRFRKLLVRADPRHLPKRTSRASALFTPASTACVCSALDAVLTSKGQLTAITRCWKRKKKEYTDTLRTCTDCLRKVYDAERC
mmetsp:Transcript_11083/g.29758  ORF Transcript_11083/g.29758 Transcript_11083/m.29758 type:complete len:324 (-) Transcript_11083:902-1873(-)